MWSNRTALFLRTDKRTGAAKHGFQLGYFRTWKFHNFPQLWTYHVWGTIKHVSTFQIIELAIMSESTDLFFFFFFLNVGLLLHTKFSQYSELWTYRFLGNHKTCFNIRLKIFCNSSRRFIPQKSMCFRHDQRWGYKDLFAIPAWKLKLDFFIPKLL